MKKIWDKVIMMCVTNAPYLLGKRPWLITGAFLEISIPLGLIKQA